MSPLTNQVTWDPSPALFENSISNLAPIEMRALLSVKRTLPLASRPSVLWCKVKSFLCKEKRKFPSASWNVFLSEMERTRPETTKSFRPVAYEKWIWKAKSEGGVWKKQALSWRLVVIAMYSQHLLWQSHHLKTRASWKMNERKDRGSEKGVRATCLRVESRSGLPPLLPHHRNTTTTSTTEGSHLLLTNSESNTAMKSVWSWFKGSEALFSEIEV